MPETGNITTALRFMLFGASWCLFLQGLIQCSIVFKRKHNIIWILSIVGLVSAIVDCTLAMSYSFFGLDLKIYTIAQTPFWILMIQCASWIYCKRITSLGGSSVYDEHIRGTPFIILAVQIPTQVTYNLLPYYPSMNFPVLISGICLSIIISVCEIYMYIALLAKIVDLLEYRTSLKKMLVYEITMGLCMLVLFDIALVVAKCSDSSLDISLRTYTYLLRIVIIIRFFDDLLQNLLMSTIVTESTSVSVESI